MSPQLPEYIPFHPMAIMHLMLLTRTFMAILTSWRSVTTDAALKLKYPRTFTNSSNRSNTTGPARVLRCQPALLLAVVVDWDPVE